MMNGPNLNLIGVREPTIYGTITLEDYFEKLKKKFNKHVLAYYQSNHEGFLLDKLHEAQNLYDGIVLNAGALTHTSIAIRDAILAISTPVFEVHISNLVTREDFRKHSYMTDVCIGSVNGMGLEGYTIAIEQLIENAI